LQFSLRLGDSSVGLVELSSINFFLADEQLHQLKS